MTDYGHPITFGLSLIPSVDRLQEMRKLAQAADAVGLDYLAIQDHAYNPEFFDVWTLITYLAAETERISYFPDVADMQLRPPTVLAKGGRFAERAVRRSDHPRRRRRRVCRRHRRHGRRLTQQE